ncbi:DUF3073 domain-containing protein [Pseudoclavibacter albus]|uniref:DUF3073 domain-containing protein n=1 Tax=Pseudoclavibacter albus TaxID=272241 RepID=UPI000825184D|nr:DUF3073 domain-containing protein [Pseudoclavibacter alba]
MGRGRQKAKHTKVARELKYSVPETNYDQLERELAGARQQQDAPADEISKWAEYLDEDDYDDYEGSAQQKLA